MGKICLISLLLVFYAFFLWHPVNLVTADLGRHIKNGELILAGEFDVLNKNFYSYTEPDFGTINHHWLAGVAFYSLWRTGGFELVHLFFILLSLLTFLFFFHIARKESSLAVAFLAGILLIPIIAERNEIRPEVFSYFFAGIFFLILWKERRQELSPKFLWLLPLLEIFWVNLHSYFILGPVLLGLFGRKKLIPVFLATLLAALVNPFGLKGALVPFTIFRNYGYPLVENQNVWFLENYGISNPNFLLLKIIAVILILTLAFMLYRNRNNFHLIYFVLGTGGLLAAFLALRNFTLFGFFALPVLSYQAGKNFENTKIGKLAVFFAALFLGGFILTTHRTQLLGRELEIGLEPGNQKAAEFFRRENIKGPIFNNYDIGGYLIWSLFPKERVFTDNRPEAYSQKFFEEIYIPAQENEEKWRELDAVYKFNAIFFSHRDLTPWGRRFLARRAADPEWETVYTDVWTIILTRRN